jgi:HlyD family secretion protein
VTPELAARRSLRRHLVAGCTLTLALMAGLGAWATMTELSGAVIAPGTVVVDTNVKKVQHPTGGVIGELRVRDGSIVRAGDVVVRLDETQARANLEIVAQALDELNARRARDEAERDGDAAVAFPPALSAQSHDPRVANLIQGERRLFEIRKAAREGQKAQLRERVAQLREEVKGLTGQTSAKSREIELIGKELQGVRELWQKNLIQLPRVTALERDAARLEGERGTLVASMAQAKGRMAEIELQILQIDQDLRTEVGKDLAEIRAKTSELTEKKVAAEDQLKRIDIRAPQDGTVHELSVHTVGGVVAPGEALMLIVPRADALAVEARISPQDIDQLRAGERAVLRFSAFNQRTTPEVNGEVSLVAADVTHDGKTGASFYTVRILLPDGELARLKGLALVPGMPVESYIQTGERTVLSYLTKPIGDQIARAWREN